MSQIKLVYSLRTLKIIMSILLISYFTGQLWYIYCATIIDISEYENALDGGSYHHSPSFLNEFDLYDKGSIYMSLSMMYFGMTTLSTVGLGDYYPVSNFERIMGCFLFLSGVSTFTYIFNSYLEILQVWLKLEKDYNENQNLD